MTRYAGVYDDIIWLSRNYLSITGSVSKAGIIKLPMEDDMKTLTDVLGLGEPAWHFVPQPWQRATQSLQVCVVLDVRSLC